ncbi:MAG: hypothetical protein EOP06_30850 [Proteobacteria bacterium]|nr:MAG: hypothetical protein EOP06_30850 [Pseudomonadota bacterium]
MSVDLEGRKLTLEENLLAGEYWDSLMFASSRIDLENARKALGKAPLAVQWAVMADIEQLWLQDHQPERDENPFLTFPLVQEPVQMPVEVKEAFHLIPQSKIVRDEPTAPHALSSYALRVLHCLKQPLALYGFAVPQRFPLR